MGKCKYLYGASIQGIQSFIFQTNKLRDIVGASELIERACTTAFNDFYSGEDEIIVSAAGNVKCLFSDVNRCRKAVLSFPKKIMEKAPGVTISQAVVRVDGNNLSVAFDALEARLHSQRNRQCKTLSAGLMATERSRQTGLPAIAGVKGFIDEGSYKKNQAVDSSADGAGATNKLYEKLYGRKAVDINPDISSLTEKNDWIAIIHADGNGLGEIVAQIAKEKQECGLQAFSRNLDEATIASAQAACKEAVGETEELLIRPVVIGGDDLTVICRASVAVKFVSSYLEHFEKETYEKTGHHLTACAGISFIKSAYPFYFGYEQAETLCGIAKKDAKLDAMKAANQGKAPSCMMFHKVQSSFVEDFDVIERKELTAADGSTYRFGPYYLIGQTDRWTIKELEDTVVELSKDQNNGIKTNVREWLTLMSNSSGKAEQKVKRVYGLSQYRADQKELFGKLTEKTTDNRYPAYDVLSLLTIMNQETK